MGSRMDFIALNSYPHYAESEKLVAALGFRLVELKITPRSGTTHILAVIAAADPAAAVGVDDCTKVHRALLPFLEERLGTDDTYMELTSPGMERTIRNAAEFPLFIGRQVRVWDRTVTDWVGGTLRAADETSLTLELTQEDGTARQQTISYADIAKAKFIHV